jgi:release factor glutamine methyltransferase
LTRSYLKGGDKPQVSGYDSRGPMAHGAEIKGQGHGFQDGSNSLRLPVPDEIYPPAEDTRLLLRAALQEAIEIGSGSGLICTELACRVRSIVATDISPIATRWVKSLGIEVVRADLFQGIEARFDLVIFNPPYLPTSIEERIPGWLNAALDGGASGRDVIFAFLEQLGSHLSSRGRALLLVSSLNGLRVVEEKARALGLEVSLKATEGCFFEELHVIEVTFANKGY